MNQRFVVSPLPDFKGSCIHLLYMLPFWLKSSRLEGLRNILHTLLIGSLHLGPGGMPPTMSIRAIRARCMYLFSLACRVEGGLTGEDDSRHKGKNIAHTGKAPYTDKAQYATTALPCIFEVI